MSKLDAEVATRFKGDCDHAAENVQYPSTSRLGIQTCVRLSK